MSKSTPADLRRNSLYPYYGTEDFGMLHHENKFFRYLHPQQAIKLLDEQSEDLFIEEQYRKIPILRGCTDRILYGSKNTAHTDCYSVIVQNEEYWMLYDSCQYEDQAELLSEINDSEGWPVWRQDIPKIIEGVGLSSVYFNPFPGFDNPDKKCTPNEWLVQNMFPARSLNAIVGVSDSFKSFLAVHLACCIATGTKFFGRDVLQGPILFLAPEGGAGIPKRRDAWKIEHGWQDCYIPFFTRSASFSFSSDEDLQFLRGKFDVSSKFAPKAVFFDTLGQSLGGYDENSAKDVNKVARYLNDLKSEFNCAFFWVDHAGYEAKRSRGSSAKFGALDTEYFVTRDGDALKVTNTKMKDDRKCSVLYLQSEQKHGSLILKQIDKPQTHTETLLKIIKEAENNSVKSLRKKFYEVCTADTPQSRQKAFKRACDTLIEDGTVLKQQAEGCAKLILRTENGHTPPPL